VTLGESAASVPALHQLDTLIWLLVTSNRSRPYSALLALAIGAVSTVLTTGTAATVYVASSAVRPTPRGEDERITLFPTSAHRQSGAARALLDSLVEPLGALPQLDSVTMRQAVALLRAGRDHSAWIDFDSTIVPSLDTLTFLRHWARSQPLPAFWGIRPGFAGVEGANDLPVHSFFPLRRFMMLNEASADSALLAGDAREAMTRARETLAAARHLLGQPILTDALVGRVLLQRGARLLVRSAQQGDDPMTAGAARRLDALAAGAFAMERSQMRVYRTLGASPEDGRLLAIAGDTRLHGALRLRAFNGLLQGACAHPREVIFGMSSERRIAFQQVAQAIEDMPRAHDLVALFEREFEFFDDGYSDAARRKLRAARPDKVSPFAWIVPQVVSDRVSMCRLQG